MLWSVLIISVVGLVKALPPSPCPDIYGYETNEYGETKGVIALLSPPRYSMVQIVTVLSSPVPVSNDQLGELTLKGGKQAATEATRQVLEGRRHVLQFVITFPPGKPIPTLYSITVNGVDFCRAPSFPVDSRARITLHSYLTTGVNVPSTTDFRLVNGFSTVGGNLPPQESYQPVSSAPQRPSLQEPLYVQYVTQRYDPSFESYSTTTSTTTFPPVIRITTSSEQTFLLEDDLAEDYGVNLNNCGVAESIPNTLVVYGTDAARGEWPWHVAIFKNTDVESSTGISFQCGGTLVTRRHVITAAHCVVERRGTKFRKLSTNSLVIYLGKNNIRSWTEEGQQAVEVEQIRVHPSFNDQYKNDLSIISLTTSAQITRFVKPICLWDRSSDLNLIQGRVGAVAGWGRDETGSITDKLKVARMPIVSQGTCIRSDPFYATYTSDNTLCAGYRNGTTVCNGDSGGGLHLNLDNPAQGRQTWYLRGVVSVSMLDTVEQRCDTHNYVIFTDVAKYMSWIRQYLAKPF